jgi:hypothetical protein
LNQSVAIAETAGLGRDGKSVEVSAAENAARDPWNDFITEFDTLHSNSAANYRRRITAGEHQGHGRRPGDPFADLFHGGQATRNPQDHMLGSTERIADQGPCGVAGMEDRGASLGQQEALLCARHIVI